MNILKKILLLILLFSLLLNPYFSSAASYVDIKKLPFAEKDIPLLYRVTEAIRNLINQISANKLQMKAQVGGGQGGGNVDVNSQPRSLAIGACKPGIECSGVVNDRQVINDPITALMTYSIDIILDDAEKKCFDKFRNYILRYDNFDEFRRVNPTIYSASIRSADGDNVLCSIARETVTENGSSFLLRLTETLSFRRTFSNNFSQTYQPRSARNKGNEKINLGFEGKLLKTDDYEIPKSRTGSNYWAAEINSYPTPQGKESYFLKVNDTPYRLDLTSEQNFTENLKGFSSDELFIDTNASSWKLKTSGFVFGRVSGSAEYTKKYQNGSRNLPELRTEEDEVKREVVNIEFCPTNCEITIEEQANITAYKSGAYNGSVKVRNYRKEKSVGTGKAITYSSTRPENLPQFQWKTLKVNVQDQRSANVELATQQDTSISYKINNDIEETNNYTTKQFNAITKTTESANISSPTVAFSETTIPVAISSRVNTTQTQFNEILKIEGSGSLSPNIRGIYDKPGSLMLVTSPVEMQGERIDPMRWFIDGFSFAYIPATNLWNIVPGPAQGSRSSFENEKSVVVATRPTVLIPKKVFVTYSYRRDDPAFSKSILDAFAKFLNELQANGAEVEQEDITSAQELYDYVDEFSNGSWWIHLGHGEPQGLVIAQTDETALYEKIVSTLNKKGVKLDVIALNNCYGGHIPIGGRVLGSISVGIANLNIGGLGTLFGFGTNTFNLTIGDMLKKLREFSGLGCS